MDKNDAAGWTDTLPTVAGSYYFRSDKFPEPQLVRVIENGGRLFAMFGKRTAYSLQIVADKFPDGQWCGPQCEPPEVTPCGT